MTTAVKLGRIWWSADNATEAAAWKEKYMKAGATSVHLEYEADRPIVDVYITLDRARAKEILGVEPGPEEWQSVLSESAQDVVHHVQGMADTFQLKFDVDSIRETVEQSARLLSVDLSEAEIVEVCDEVLGAQAPQAEAERG